MGHKIEKSEKLLEDKSEYNQGVEAFNKENWGRAKELLSKVSDDSPYYQDAQDKAEEAQQKITEKQITETVKRVTEVMEAQRRAETEKIKEKTENLENKIKELEQVQQFQPQPGFKASEIVENLGKYIVQVVCYDKYLNPSFGSGIIYSASDAKTKTVILTNYHVTQYADLTLEYPCAVFYSPDPTKGFTDFYFAEPIYYPSIVSLSTMKSIDFDFLRIKAKFRFPEYERIEIIPYASLLISSLFPIPCRENEIKIGEEIVVLGYPPIGGQYLTATEGIISGYEGAYYFTASAKIEQGSSGGGAFLKSIGCLAGMPTFVKMGKIESFARLINIPILEHDYLSKIWTFSSVEPPTPITPPSSNSSQKAHGTITVYNAYSTSPQVLVASTRFVSADGKLFRSIEKVTVPGGKYEEGKFIPGTIDIEIVADQPGPEYELNCSKMYPCTFSIPGFAGTDRYTAFYAKAFSPIKR